MKTSTVYSDYKGTEEGNIEIRNIYIGTGFLIIFIIFMFLFSGCGKSRVSKSDIQKDLQSNSIFSVHDTNIEEFKVIKRQTDKTKDEVYVNVKGKNEIYSLSLNYKIVYKLYDEGWMLETIEAYSNEKNVDEIVPLCGPSKDVLDEYLSSVDLENYSSYDSFLIKDTNIELKETSNLILDNYYGEADYVCEIQYEYYYFTETVTFPVKFSFIELAQNGKMGWFNGYDTPTQDVIKRDILVTPNMCGTWNYQGEWQNPFSGSIDHYDVNLVISDVKYNEESKESICTIQEYTFESKETKDVTSGEMKFFVSYSSNGKATVNLTWCDGSNAHPSNCSNLSFSHSYFQSYLRRLVLTPNTKAYYGFSEENIILNKKVAEIIITDENGNKIISSENIKNISVHCPENDEQYGVLFEFDEVGKKSFADASKRLLGRKTLFYLDDVLIMSPVISQEITDGKIWIPFSSKDEAYEFYYRLV